MRSGAQAAQRGILAAINAATPAWSDKDLAEAINVGMLAEGLDGVQLVLVGSGEAARGFFPATTAPMRRGSLVRIDILAVLKGYAIDVGRMAVVGEASAAQERAYADALELNRRILESMRPGVRASSVFAACQEAAGSLGLELLDQPSIGIGHTVGINPQDFPTLKPDDDTLLEQGMVLNIEPDSFGPGRELMHVEEIVVVDEPAATSLSWDDAWSSLPSIA
jgi:Xaa-Pro aminopeptidase